MGVMSTPEHLTDRSVLRIAGAERKSFLQGLITQDVDAAAPGAPVFAALLTPQGKILFDFFIFDDGDALLLDCDAQAAPALAKRLSLYKLRAAVTVEADPALRVFAHDAPFSLNGAQAAPDPRHAALGWRLVARGEGDDASRTGGASGAYEARRLALGAPEFGKDFDSGEMFLMDVNYDALSGVSYKKGCFVGQEVASRMKRKGEARKRTLIAAIQGPPPERGTPVTAGASTLGEILSGGPSPAPSDIRTSTGTSSENGGENGRALAMIRLDRWEKAAAAGTLSVANGAETVLSFPDYLERD